MANICSNTMEIAGDEKEIADLAKRIEEQDEELLKLFAWFESVKGDFGLWDDTLQVEPGEIRFSYGSKWTPPEKGYLSLVKKFPRLKFTGTFVEPAMDIFGRMDGEDLIDMTPLDWYTDYNPEFYEERQRIEKSPYKEFLKYALKFDPEEDDDDFDYLASYVLVPVIMKRIEEKDLPLFIGLDWCKDELEKKLKKGE